MKKIIFLVFSFLSLVAQDAFISANDLRDSFDNEKLVVIDVSDSYKIGHIKGSISFDVNYLIDKVKSYQALKSHKRLLEIFGDLGLRDDAKIVIYSRNNLKGLKKASFLAFALLSSGFDDISILDGVYMSWVFEYSELITKQKKELEENKLSLKSKDFIIDIKSMSENINNINLIDARERIYYDYMHIPSATSCSIAMKFKGDFTIKRKEKIANMCLGYFKDNSLEKVIYADDIFTASLEWYIIYKVLAFKNTKIYYDGFSQYKNLELDIITKK